MKAQAVTESFKCGENVMWSYNSETYTVTISGNGDMDEVLNKSWNLDLYAKCRDEAKKVVIEDGITSMTRLLFVQFLNLETAAIGKDISVISYGAFDSCDKLSKVVLKKGLKKIDEYAFELCKSLKTIDLPYGLESIGMGAFHYCGLQGELVLPETVKEIGTCAFYAATGLTKIVVPVGVKKIENLTFVNYATVVIMNRNCEIVDAEGGSTGFAYTIQGSISGYVGSTAHEYALKYNKAFIPLPEHDHKYTTKVTKKATCSQKGKKVYTCSCGDTYTKTIAKTEHTYKSSVTKATLSKNGKIVKTCKVCGYKTNSTIAKIKSVKLSSSSYIYDKKEKKPTVTVKDSNGKTIKSKYYTVAYSGKRKAVGTYSVTITFKGNYSGSKTLKFKIVLGQVTGVKYSEKGKGMTLSWKKVEGATGYILYEYNTRTGKYEEKFRTKSNSIGKDKVSGNSYTVRIRAYYVRDGKEYYGEYSSAKKIKL